MYRTDPPRTAPRLVQGLAGTGALGLALALAAPSPLAALSALTDPAAVDPFVPLVAAATLVAQILVGWLVALAVLALLQQAPGLCGRAAAHASSRLAPAAVRRVVHLSLGLTLTAGVAGPLAHGVASADGPTAPGPPTATSPSPELPPLLDWPVPTPSATPMRSPLDAAMSPLTRQPRHGPTARRTHPVRPGDTLWSIAASALPPRASAAQIAVAWPAWWRANRAAVGPDPDLIFPGTRLRPPSDPRPARSTA